MRRSCFAVCWFRSTVPRAHQELSNEVHTIKFFPSTKFAASFSCEMVRRFCKRRMTFMQAVSSVWLAEAWSICTSFRPGRNFPVQRQNSLPNSTMVYSAQNKEALPPNSCTDSGAAPLFHFSPNGRKNADLEKETGLFLAPIKRKIKWILRYRSSTFKTVAKSRVFLWDGFVLH